MSKLSFNLVSIEAFCIRVPVKMPIKVAFGTFRDRPLVLLRVVDDQGAEGWGEVWANWPASGAEHRARLSIDLGERLVGRHFDSPEQMFQLLSQELEVLVLQTLEVGPIAQVLAGFDIACWDLVARRSNQALHSLISDRGAKQVPVYVTGINPDQPEIFAAARQAEGFRAFKLKTGFGHALDVRNLQAMREVLGPNAELTCDSNQNLDLPAAIAFVEAVAPLKMGWFEEPLRVDAPAELARVSSTPLAGWRKFSWRTVRPGLGKFGSASHSAGHHQVGRGQRKSQGSAPRGFGRQAILPSLFWRWCFAVGLFAGAGGGGR